MQSCKFKCKEFSHSTGKVDFPLFLVLSLIILDGFYNVLPKMKPNTLKCYDKILEIELDNVYILNNKVNTF